jgi:hypothetical protein
MYMYQEESKLQAHEMKFLKTIGIVGKPMTDRIRETYIRGELKMEEIQNQIKESRLKWFGHGGEDEHSIPKRLLEMRVSGRRHRGRPCT